jgi:hypothetical protein
MEWQPLMSRELVRSAVDIQHGLESEVSTPAINASADAALVSEVVRLMDDASDLYPTLSILAHFQQWSSMSQYVPSRIGLCELAFRAVIDTDTPTFRWSMSVFARSGGRWSDVHFLCPGVISPNQMEWVLKEFDAADLITRDIVPVLAMFYEKASYLRLEYLLQIDIRLDWSAFALAVCGRWWPDEPVELFARYRPAAIRDQPEAFCLQLAATRATGSNACRTVLGLIPDTYVPPYSVLLGMVRRQNSEGIVPLVARCDDPRIERHEFWRAAVNCVSHELVEYLAPRVTETYVIPGRPLVGSTLQAFCADTRAMIRAAERRIATKRKASKRLSRDGGKRTSVSDGRD